MKIVILDGFAAQPGDLDWSEIQSLGECVIYDTTSAEQLHERISDAEIVLTNKTPIKAEDMDRTPELKYIGIMTTGTNLIDIQAARERGIVVTNLPAYSSESVAQMVFSHLLNIVMSVNKYNEFIHKGLWQKEQPMDMRRADYIELYGQSIGIVGFGNIGSAVARIAHGFGMSVLVYTSKPQKQLPAYCKSVGLKDLFSSADVVSLHCPLTAETKGLVDTDKLKSMKPTAILINTARGALVDEEALKTALINDWIAAAGLDVLSEEPPGREHPLFNLRNCYLTPHVGWATKNACRRIADHTAKNLTAFLSGNPINTVLP